MDFIAVIVIGLMIYNFFEKLKTKNQPGRTISEKQIPGRPKSLREMFSGGDSKPTTLVDLFNQWVESQNPKQVSESKQIPERNFFDLDEGPDFRPEELTQSSRYGGSIGGLSTQGEQGVEGLPGIEGTSFTEVTPVGFRGIDGTTPIESTRGPKEMKNNLDIRLTERELMQGIVWAEVLGRPRALRPFRTFRS